MLASNYSDSYTKEEQKIIEELSRYKERYISDDGTVFTKTVHDPRFLTATHWRFEMFSDIEQFKDITPSRPYKPRFYFKSPIERINLEIRYVLYHNIFNDKWSIGNVFHNHQAYIGKILRFLEQQYPKINSLLDLKFKEISEEWINWLQENKYAIYATKHHREYLMEKSGKTYTHRNMIATYLPNLCKMLHGYINDREEWEKDAWDVRNLEKYGVTHNKTSLSYYIHFECIHQPEICRYTKWYIKYKLMNKTFAWNTARMYMDYLPMFFNKITEIEPTWNTLQHLERKHIITYIQWLD